MLVLMPTAADQIIAALRTGHDSLAEFVAPLGEDGVNHPSGASEWTVAQVLSHLGSGAEITLAGLDAALTGTDERGPGFNESVWDRWNAKSPQDQTADFITINEKLVSRYEGIDDATRESLRIDMGFLPEPVDLAFAATMRLNEFSLHAWDVLVGFDPSATVPSEAAGLLVDGNGWLFGFIAHPEALDARGDVAVHLSEPDRTFGLTIADAVSLADEPSAPGAVFSGPAEAWLRLTAGRLGPEYTPASVTVTGGLVDLADLRQVFPGSTSRSAGERHRLDQGHLHGLAVRRLVAHRLALLGTGEGLAQGRGGRVDVDVGGLGLFA